MSDDVEGIVRTVAGYSKIPDEDGEKGLEVEYKLKPLKLKFLQKLFEIDPQDPDPAMVDLIYCYRINAEQAKALQEYVIDGVIDVDKYDFMLECYEDK